MIDYVTDMFCYAVHRKDVSGGDGINISNSIHAYLCSPKGSFYSLCLHLKSTTAFYYVDALYCLFFGSIVDKNYVFEFFSKREKCDILF